MDLFALNLKLTVEMLIFVVKRWIKRVSTKKKPDVDASDK